jgi:membrane fusion protein
MSQGLFRQEVIDAKRGEWLGSIIVATPLSRWAWALFAGGLAAALITFLVFGHYTRRENVTGQLVPSAGLINFTAISAGSIRRVWAHEGQSVHRGDPLVEISSEQDSAALGDTHALVGQQLSLQRQRLEQDLQTQQLLQVQQAQALHAKIISLEAQQAQVASQLKLEQRQADSAQSLLQRIQPLASKGYVSAFQIEQQKSAVLEALAQCKTLTRQSLDLRQQIDAAQAQLAQLPLDVSTQRSSTERQLAEVRRSMAQNEMQRAVVLRAPRDGVMSAVLMKEGQMVAAGQPLLSELPAGSTLQAQLLVPSRAIGFIVPGSRVVLRYQAFPYQKFGQQYGRVTDISRSALSPAEVSALIGQAVQQPEPLYRVQVALDSQQVMAYGKAEPVKPGMALDADILMERRRLIEWVFEPLYGLAHRLVGGASHG